MNKFGSGFNYIIFIILIFLIFFIASPIFIEDTNFKGLLIACSALILFVVVDIFFTYNGLIFTNDKLIICNIFIKQKFTYSYEEIREVELVKIFRGAYIEISTRNSEQKKYR